MANYIVYGYLWASARAIVTGEWADRVVGMRKEAWMRMAMEMQEETAGWTERRPNSTGCMGEMMESAEGRRNGELPLGLIACVTYVLYSYVSCRRRSTPIGTRLHDLFIVLLVNKA